MKVAWTSNTFQCCLIVWHVTPSLRPKYWTLYLFTSANLKHTLLTDVILRHTAFSQPILPPSGPVMRPDSLPRDWCYITPLLTYLEANASWDVIQLVFSVLLVCWMVNCLSIVLFGLCCLNPLKPTVAIWVQL